MLISFIYWSGSVYKKKTAGKLFVETIYWSYQGRIYVPDLTDELLNKVKEIKDRLKVTWYLHFHSSIVLIIASLLRMMIYLRWQQNIPKKCTWFWLHFTHVDVIISVIIDLNCENIVDHANFNMTLWKTSFWPELDRFKKI